MSFIVSTFIAAALVNNLVLVQLLGVSSFFSYSRRFSASVELAFLSFIVLFFSAAINLILQTLILEPLSLRSLELILFVAVSAGITTILSIQLADKFPLISRRNGRALLLMSSNSAVIGFALMQSSSLLGFGGKVIAALGAAAGFSIALLAFAALRLRIEQSQSPRAMRGIPLYLISAGIASMAFLGFSGLV